MSGPLYCDSSALVTLYVPEAGSADFNRRVAGRQDLVVSDLAVTEVVSALARRLREGALTRDVVRRVQQSIVGHLDTGVFRRVELTRDIHRSAEHILANLSVPLRAADALHLALATASRAASMASFDVRLQRAARALGLVTYPA